MIGGMGQKHDFGSVTPSSHTISHEKEWERHFTPTAKQITNGITNLNSIPQNERNKINVTNLVGKYPSKFRNNWRNTAKRWIYMAT